MTQNNDTPHIKKIRLTTPADIRRALAWAVNQMIQGLLEPVAVGKLAYCCSIALKCYEIETMADLDKRLTIIEDKG